MDRSTRHVLSTRTKLFDVVLMEEYYDGEVSGYCRFRDTGMWARFDKVWWSFNCDLRVFELRMLPKKLSDEVENTLFDKSGRRAKGVLYSILSEKYYGWFKGKADPELILIGEGLASKVVEWRPGDSPNPVP